MTDYTLGPWTAVGNRVYATAASGKDTMTTIEVAVATRADPRARAKVEQNARLITAAPDLLAIAREYADSCLDCSGSGTVQRYDTDDSDCAVTEFVDCPECAHVRAVIAAVEGA